MSPDPRSRASLVRAAGTVGAGIEAVGESIAEIGRAMDILALELRDPCPENG